MHMALHSAALLRGPWSLQEPHSARRGGVEGGRGLPAKPSATWMWSAAAGGAHPKHVHRRRHEPCGRRPTYLQALLLAASAGRKAVTRTGSSTMGPSCPVRRLQRKPESEGEGGEHFAAKGEILVQAARQRTPSARRSSRPSGARLSTATTINETVHFSSISVYMGQGGSGPGTRASGLMVDKPVWERHQGINEYSTTVPWGAIGEIGLRKFGLGQKLIGPADTSFLMKLARRIGLGACRAARPSWSESTSETG
eukprot:s7483_g4.t1